jgi:hypothetical protein
MGVTDSEEIVAAIQEAASRPDIRAVFRWVSNPKRADIDLVAQMRSVLKSRRKSGSMSVAKGGPKLKAPKALIAEMIKERNARVGYLASAWATAAQSVGKIRVPAWVSNFQGSSGFSVIISARRI